MTADLSFVVMANAATGRDTPLRTTHGHKARSTAQSYTLTEEARSSSQIDETSNAMNAQT